MKEDSYTHRMEEQSRGQVGDGVSTSNHFIPLTRSIHLLRYFHRVPSTSRSPTTTAGTHKGLVLTIADLISVASPNFPPYSSPRFNLNQTQPSSPVPPSSPTRSSTLIINISERYPSGPRQVELLLYTPHLGSASIIQASQTQTWILGLPTSQNVFAISSIAIYSLPMINRIHSSESS